MSEFSLKQIQVFVAVAELGSFTQAAQALFLSQSTVSAHLAALDLFQAEFAHVCLLAA